MGWFSSNEDKKAAKAEYDAASAELERVSKRDREETPDYVAANSRKLAASENVPWWKR